MEQLMNFSNFLKLNESKDTVSLDDAVNFFKKHCKEYDIEQPLFRRMKLKQAEYAMIDSSDRIRKSLTGKDYMMHILDRQTKKLNPDYPLRSNSSFFSMDRESILPRFGDMYVIIPIDGSVIAVSKKYDDINYGKSNEFRRVILGLDNANIQDDNFNYMLKDIKIEIEKEKYYFERTFPDCKTYKDIEERLIQMCNLDDLGIIYTDIKDIQKNKIKGEAWCKTKCLMIIESEWYDFKEELKKVH